MLDSRAALEVWTAYLLYSFSRRWSATAFSICCNPRFNGASYPKAIARKLGLTHWLARAFPTSYRTFADLDLTGIDYDASQGEGVILVNWGPILVGNLLFLIAGRPEIKEEDDPLFNAGCGSVLNEHGRVEMDAGIMDGRDLGAGADNETCAVSATGYGEDFMRTVIAGTGRRLAWLQLIVIAGYCASSFERLRRFTGSTVRSHLARHPPARTLEGAQPPLLG